MKNARIKISSRGDGFSLRVEKPCKAQAGECVKVRYEEEGDECTLTIADGEVTMSRRGTANFDLAFAEGKTLACKIGYGGGFGEVDCVTHSLYIARGRRGVNVKINYSLGGSEISLSATIIFDE